ncbi:MAG TPA: hypothetical protein VFR86_21065, partial [Burkholderiaceae bacterium]|nr:hypothetical protein [Burkholderiaceae bacterium]
MRLLLRAVFRALFLDVPFLIDSVWRRLDFRFNSEYRYRCLGVPGGGALEQRPPWQRSMFWFFALTVVFVAYGPVWDGLCTVFVPPFASWALGLAGLALAAVALRLLSVMTAGGKRRLASRFNSPELRTEDPRLLRWRRHVAALVLTVLMLIVFVLLALAAGWLLARAVATPQACHWVEGYATPSAWRLAACLGAILLFALACRLIQSTRGLVFIQFVLLVLVAWLTTAVLIPAGSSPLHGKEATGLPYRHLFAFVAPALCFVVCLAPFLARVKLSAKIPFAVQRWILRGTGLALLLLAVVLGLRVAQIEPVAGAVDAAPLLVVGAIVLLSYALMWPLELVGVAPATRQFFAERLTQRELFEARGTDPQLTFDRVAYALVHGILYRPLQLVLPSALLAFVARPSWLLWLVALGFVFSVLMLAWGSIANRWQQMVLIVERWFLSGAALP